MCYMDMVKPWLDKALHLTPKGCKKEGEVCPASQQACEANMLFAPWLINTEP